MSEEIIIDGVDVAECEFYSIYTGQCKIQQVFQKNEIVGIIEKPYGKHLECNLSDKICQYKQLQRLKAENEELKIKLLQQNEVNTLMTNLPWNDDPCGICESKQNYEHLKRALEDVKEILKHSMSLNTKAYSHFDKIEKAIDKINEVLK